MTEYWFYHLETSMLEGVLPELLEKVRGRNWRALVKVPAEKLAELDKYLWTFKDDSFLPHGKDDEPMADSQPILLTSSAANSDGFDCVFLIGGEDIDVAADTARCLIMIDGRNDASVQASRSKWKTLKDAGANLSYWQQNDRGAWEKKA